jgi:hypothetical protein
MERKQDLCEICLKFFEDVSLNWYILLVKRQFLKSRICFQHQVRLALSTGPNWLVCRLHSLTCWRKQSQIPERCVVFWCSSRFSLSEERSYEPSVRLSRFSYECTQPAWPGVFVAQQWDRRPHGKTHCCATMTSKHSARMASGAKIRSDPISLRMPQVSQQWLRNTLVQEWPKAQQWSRITLVQRDLRDVAWITHFECQCSPKNTPFQYCWTKRRKKM